jgi:hypothetical protein
VKEDTMERSIGSTLIGDRARNRGAVAMIRDWSFPLVVAVGWVAAVAYTLLILGVGPSSVRAESTTASRPQLTAVFDVDGNLSP